MSTTLYTVDPVTHFFAAGYDIVQAGTVVPDGVVWAIQTAAAGAGVTINTSAGGAPQLVQVPSYYNGGTGSPVGDALPVGAEVKDSTGAVFEKTPGGWISAGGSGVSALVPTAVKTTAYTAAVGDLIPVDTTSGAVTVTLPAAPADKAQVAVKHVIQGSANAVTIARGGSSDVFNKAGGSTSLTLTTLNQLISLQYQASTGIWYVLNDSLSLTALNGAYVTVTEAPLNAARYGAKGDGTTDDTAALAAWATAAAAAGSGVRMYLPPGVYPNTAEVTIPAGAEVFGAGLANSRINGFGFRIRAKCHVHDLAFSADTTSQKHGIYIDTPTAQNEWEVSNCAFDNHNSAVYVDRTADNSIHERGKVHHCTFTNFSVAGIFTIRANRMGYDNNTFKTNQNGARSILFYGGSRNRVIGNSVTYGTTGITFLYSRSLAGTSGIMQGNIITGNTVQDCSEEGISFDVHGNTAADIGAMEYDTVASVTGGSKQITLTASGWSSAGNAYLNYYVGFISGALAGQVAQITAQSNGTFTFGGLTTTQVGTITAGDTVMICAPMLNNVISGNFVDSAVRGTTKGIYLYGPAVLNSVVGNTAIGRGIGCSSLNSLSKTTPSYANNFGRAAAMSNTFAGNTVVGDDMIGDYTDFGSSTAFTSVGNVFVGNVIRGGRLKLDRQKATRLLNVADSEAITNDGGTVPAVTGAKGSNAALGSLMTALSGWGLVTDGTSA